jgi:hypothetical protein
MRFLPNWQVLRLPVESGIIIVSCTTNILNSSANNMFEDILKSLVILPNDE